MNEEKLFLPRQEKRKKNRFFQTKRKKCLSLFRDRGASILPEGRRKRKGRFHPPTERRKNRPRDCPLTRREEKRWAAVRRVLGGFIYLYLTVEPERRERETERPLMKLREDEGSRPGKEDRPGVHTR